VADWQGAEVGAVVIYLPYGVLLNPAGAHAARHWLRVYYAHPSNNFPVSAHGQAALARCRARGLQLPAVNSLISTRTCSHWPAASVQTWPHSFLTVAVRLSVTGHY